MAQATDGTAAFSPQFRRYTDQAGHELEYATVSHPGSHGLVVHFSAFFGKWGDARQYRDRFQGYFHRLRMLGSCPEHDWLFLCDSFGVHANGTYYTGEQGDRFVERGVIEIVRAELDAHRLGPESMVTVGSSMGATGALVVALTLGAKGIVAISPHVDLDIAATLCGRYDEVAFVCADGDPNSEASRTITHRARTLLEQWPEQRPLPRLFVQSVVDDRGVHSEQVVPLVDEWRARGGEVEHDVRTVGGHTSDYATRPLLLDAVEQLLTGGDIDLARYQRAPGFAAVHKQPPLMHRIRRRLRIGTRIRSLRRRIRRARSGR